MLGLAGSCMSARTCMQHEKVMRFSTFQVVFFLLHAGAPDEDSIREEVEAAGKLGVKGRLCHWQPI